MNRHFKKVVSVWTARAVIMYGSGEFTFRTPRASLFACFVLRGMWLARQEKQDDDPLENKR